MKVFWLIRAATGLAAFTLAVAAWAQYVWLDEKGVKQFSDMPPPASISKNRILKEPRNVSQSASEALPGTSDGGAQNPAPTTATAVKTNIPMTTAEKNADFQKRRREQAETEKKAAEQAKLAADKSKNCERARAYNRALESGERIAHTDKSGERAFLSDEQRDKEIRETKRMLDECR